MKTRRCGGAGTAGRPRSQERRPHAAQGMSPEAGETDTQAGTEGRGEPAGQSESADPGGSAAAAAVRLDGAQTGLCGAGLGRRLAGAHSDPGPGPAPEPTCPPSPALPALAESESDSAPDLPLQSCGPRHPDCPCRHPAGPRLWAAPMPSPPPSTHTCAHPARLATRSVCCPAAGAPPGPSRVGAGSRARPSPPAASPCTLSAGRGHRPCVSSRKWPLPLGRGSLSEEACTRLCCLRSKFTVGVTLLQT